ncbi:MAG: DUF4189 domain-containing protein [Rhodobacter sp.]|nr:DUF4189 domain-containing protein [Rhodobacter sp.]
MKRWVVGTFSAGLLLAASAAQAGQCGYDFCWGAVGIGPYGAYGYSYAHRSEDAAIGAAQDGCGGNCNNIHTFYNTCGAMAQGSDDAWGFGWAGTRAQAEANALGYCRDYGSGCAITVWACSP